MSDLREISFRKINREEFEIFEKWSIKNYAENLIKSGDEKFLFKVCRWVVLDGRALLMPQSRKLCCLSLCCTNVCFYVSAVF